MATYQVIVTCCLKGGVGKTKTTLFVAEELAQRGHEVLIIDADPGTQGVTGWVSTLVRDYPDAALPWNVAQWARSEGLLGQWVPKQAAAAGAAFVVLDVGAEIPDVVTYASMLADQIIVPVGTQQEEVHRIAPTMTSIRTGARPGVVPRVLLTRVDAPGIGAARRLRDALTTDGHQVYATEIRRSKDLYDRYGMPIGDTGEYRGLVDELLAVAA